LDRCTLLGLKGQNVKPAQPNRHNATRFCALFVPLTLSLMISGCSGGLPQIPKISELNPFAEEEKKLSGKRVSVMPASNGIGGAELAPATDPIQLASRVSNTDWSQPGGVSTNAPGHLTYGGALRRVWTRDIGAGSSSSGRLSASPVVYGGRIFAMDAESVVTALSAASGQRIWSAPLKPEHERAAEGYGGGLAVSEGRVFAATGFGLVVALDAGSGKKLWETNLKIPVRASPTAAKGQVFLVASDGRVFSLNAADGMELWVHRGLPQGRRIISNPSPAVAGDYVIAPFPSGDLVAINTEDGLPAWSDNLTSTRLSASLGVMSDVSRPVVDGDRVFAAGHSGRVAAIDLESGERRWSLSIPGVQPPAVSGNYVFLVDIQGQLIAVDDQSGKPLWTAKLPGATTWSGPVLASGKLWLTSHKGHVVGADAKTGRVVTQKSTGTPIYLAPVIAAGRMYILTDTAQLIAFN